MQIAFFPEACDFLADNKKDIVAMAEPLTGQTVASYKEIAVKNDIWLSLGGVHEAVNILISVLHEFMENRIIVSLTIHKDTRRFSRIMRKRFTIRIY